MELLANSPTPGSAGSLGILSVTLTVGGTFATVSTAAPTGLRSATTDQFRVVIGAEIIVVQASLSGASPWTILARGAESSTAASHAAGTSIYHYPTAGALDGRYVRTDGTGMPASVVLDAAATAVDIDSTGVAAGNALLYDAASGKYKPGTVAGGGGGGVSNSFAIAMSVALG